MDEMSESTVMARLKTGTWDLHAVAETRELQRRLVRGEVGREQYAAWLGQMYLVHSTLDGFLRPRVGVDPRFAAVDEQQLQSGRLARDLGALGVNPSAIEPLPATRHVCEQIAQAASEEPLRLLGFHYVLEGSTNGNRFIARKLRTVLPIDGGAGFDYLDPYGERQTERWASFKRAMSGLSWDEIEIETLVAAAREMFYAVGELSLELDASASTVRI
jgi:heme oxygenase (biliverdin-producing, ferredoxin)